MPTSAIGRTDQPNSQAPSGRDESKPGSTRKLADRVTSASKLDIEHVVPLAEAWQSGAYRWNADTRMRYANDLGYGPDLVAVTAHANRSKGDKDPSAYLPPRKRFDCTYQAWWVAVKWRWHLTVDRAEKSWLTSHLKACGWPKVTKPTRPRIGASGTGGSGGSGAASLPPAPETRPAGGLQCHAWACPTSTVRRPSALLASSCFRVAKPA